MPVLATLLGYLTLSLVYGSGEAASPTMDERLAADGWEEITFDGKTPNRFSPCGEGCIELETNNSVSMVGREVAVDLSKTPMLTWEWQIEAPVVASDLTIKGKDDRAAALYVTFPFDPETASFAEKMMRPMVEMARGTDTPGRVISYVWGGFGDAGQVVESPFFGSSNVMVISRTSEAPVGQWLQEKVDVFADYERIFGHIPKSVDHILISADSDDTGTKNRASVRHILFQAR